VYQKNLALFNEYPCQNVSDFKNSSTNRLGRLLDMYLGFFETRCTVAGTVMIYD